MSLWTKASAKSRDVCDVVVIASGSSEVVEHTVDSSAGMEEASESVSEQRVSCSLSDDSLSWKTSQCCLQWQPLT